ncbi:uncharacterized protein A4U43_C08F18690 [Asparagus officinalis]|uniref:U-box domain-containing protein 25 n=1 Tax=Asparagus officinalis TaxID=4686 RepID=UPI00098E6EEE|nr:U-box domain-containing protein 25 [Asparagus officinalis]ONK60458.1 uncharacterized protein A4U43_C08F18690 [Asparagus officinalis]
MELARDEDAHVAKVLLALLLVEPNRCVAVETGVVVAAVEAVVATNSTSTSTAERALAALELMCTIEKGAAEVRAHALAALAMGEAIENMQGHGRECAIGVLAAVYGGSGDQAKDAPEEVIRAVMMAMQGECSLRWRRKGVFC